MFNRLHRIYWLNRQFLKIPAIEFNLLLRHACSCCVVPKRRDRVFDRIPKFEFLFLETTTCNSQFNYSLAQQCMYIQRNWNYLNLRVTKLFFDAVKKRPLKSLRISSKESSEPVENNINNYSITLTNRQNSKTMTPYLTLPCYCSTWINLTEREGWIRRYLLNSVIARATVSLPKGPQRGVKNPTRHFKPEEKVSKPVRKTRNRLNTKWKRCQKCQKHRRIPPGFTTFH